MLTALIAQRGPCYADLDEISYISGPFQKRGYEFSRQIGTKGGFAFYILDNDYNRTVLKPLLPENAAELVKAMPAAPATPKAERPARKPRRPKTTDALSAPASAGQW